MSAQYICLAEAAVSAAASVFEWQCLVLCDKYQLPQQQLFPVTDVDKERECRYNKPHLLMKYFVGGITILQKTNH